jgi:hypothetical protein
MNRYVNVKQKNLRYGREEGEGKKIIFFCFKLIFFYLFLNHFNVLVLKIVFLKKKFNIFLNKKHFEKL